MLVPLALLVAAGSANGQTKSESVRVAECPLPPATAGGSPGGGFRLSGKVVITAIEPFCSAWTVITVFEDRNSQWHIRREASDTGPLKQWASSTTCPVMLDWLEKLDRLPIRFGIGPVRPIEPSNSIPSPLAPPMVDGVEYSVRSYFAVRQPSGKLASVTLVSNEGEVADWSSGFLQAVQPCWKVD